MITRKGRTIKTALLVYALMILIVIGLRVKAEAQAPWDYGWGQGYYPTWGGSTYPFSGSFQGTYQWGSPQYSFGGLFQGAQYMNWGQRSFPFSTASYGWGGYNGQASSSNNSKLSSAVFSIMPLPGQPSVSEFPGAVIVYAPPSSLTQNYWDTGIGYFSDPGIDTFTSGTRYFNNEYIIYKGETPWEADFRLGLAPSPEPPQR